MRSQRLTFEMRGKQRRLCVGKSSNADPPLFVLSIEGLGAKSHARNLLPTTAETEEGVIRSFFGENRRSCTSMHV
jgi:hypothetical protein